LCRGSPVVKCDDSGERTRDDTETADHQVIAATALHAGQTHIQIYRHRDRQTDSRLNQ